MPCAVLSHSDVSNSLRPRGLKPPLSPGKSTKWVAIPFSAHPEPCLTNFFPRLTQIWSERGIWQNKFRNFTQARRERKKETKTIIWRVFMMYIFFPHHLCICEMRMKQKWGLASSPSAKPESRSLHFLVNFNYAICIISWILGNLSLGIRVIFKMSGCMSISFRTSLPGLVNWERSRICPAFLKKCA